MAGDQSGLDPDELDPDDVESYLAMARIRGEESDTGAWVSHLEDIVRVAWRLMTEEQRETFRAEPEILALTDSFGDFADGRNAGF